MAAVSRTALMDSWSPNLCEHEPSKWIVLFRFHSRRSGRESASLYWTRWTPDGYPDWKIHR